MKLLKIIFEILSVLISLTNFIEDKSPGDGMIVPFATFVKYRCQCGQVPEVIIIIMNQMTDKLNLIHTHFPTMLAFNPSVVKAVWSSWQSG